jgi:hypothetical protein
MFTYRQGLPQSQLPSVMKPPDTVVEIFCQFLKLQVMLTVKIACRKSTIM